MVLSEAGRALRAAYMAFMITLAASTCVVCWVLVVNHWWCFYTSADAIHFRAALDAQLGRLDGVPESKVTLPS